ncbi:MAG: glycosyl hydrolase [Pseudoflavonifractor sp.]|nr:glycosyl hydrolase [Pseudoflavonifractor sp.]
MNKSIISIGAALAMLMPSTALTEIIPAGGGSYTTAYPGVDQAGRNGYPTANLLLSGKATDRPVPSNEWWSNKLVNASPGNLFNYPLGLQTWGDGLGILKNPIGGAIAADRPLTVGVAGLTCDAATVSDYTDWTVTFSWTNGSDKMEAIVPTGSPFVYFTKHSDGAVVIDRANWGTVEIDGNIAVITGSFNNASYALYAPAGSRWTDNGGRLTSTLDGKDYWAVALLPSGTDAMATARNWEKHAFAFPTDTRTSWVYDEKTGKVTTTYHVTTDIKEGDGPFLMGLLPHHQAHVKGNPQYENGQYETARGTMRILAANSFTTELTFHGILPTLPQVAESDNGYSSTELDRLINLTLNDDGLADWTDSYNDGQLLNRLVQTGRIAREKGNTEAYRTATAKVKKRLENWLTYTAGEKAFLFYYYKPWGTLLGYPAGHGQDTNINDHHFHWGYMIHAAAWIAQDDPAWLKQWGPMVELLIRDAASVDRDDPMFPYLRAFSPYAGHCWANGTASLGPGNDQESTSESMQFHSSLIHWGELTGNKAIRDLGIYMYVTEQTAIEEYWFDIHDRNLYDGYKQSGRYVVSRVFTNNYDSANFWGAGPEGSYGIQLYPIHGGSFYLVDNPDWAASFWRAFETDTPVLQNVRNDNVWYDTLWQFLAMMDAEKAIRLYDSYLDRGVKFGVSTAQTYQWLHSMAQLGKPDRTITADYPIAAAFENDGKMTYVAHNYSSSPRTVTFSDGGTLEVPANSMATSEGVSTRPIDPVDPIDPTPNSPTEPDEPDTDGGYCSITSSSATDGRFNGPYTVRYRTVSDGVEIVARFDGEYTGLAVAYIFDESNGFKEIQMVSDGDATFKGSISGVSAGDEVRFRVKIAYAGGLGVTEAVVYEVGTKCGSTGLDLLPDDAVNISLTTDGTMLHVNAKGSTAHTYVWDAAGLFMYNGIARGYAAINASAWPEGIYFVRVETPAGLRVVKISKM